MKSGYKISRHAAIRYRERVRPVSLREATREIERLIESATWSDRAPDWVKLLRRCDGFLVVADLAFIVVNGTIVTCVSKGWVPPELRDRRRLKKKERKTRLARRRGL